MPTRLRVERLTGYQRAHTMVRRFLERGVGLVSYEGCELDLALAALGRTPVSYTGKLDVALHPGDRADHATKRVLTQLLEIMEATEDGMRRDLDPEFLHDFRVAVRRTRSCLSQVPGVLRGEVTRRFADEFAWLGKLTGPGRDLDVFLLKLADYGAELPESTRRDLAPFVARLRRRRRAAQRRQIQGLDSERYRRLKRDWRALVGTDADESAPNAARPIGEVATERIRRAYVRVRKRGRSLNTQTAAETIHRLRVDCKKLRYLLVFFRRLFEEDQVRSVVRSLKRLQDDLGDYNDLRVQQRELTGMATDIFVEGDAGAPAFLAMGRLIERLEVRQGAVRHRLATAVKGFVNDRTANEIAELRAR